MTTGDARGPVASTSSSSAMAGTIKASRTAPLPGAAGSPTSITEEEVEVFLSAIRSAEVDKKVNLIQLWGLKLESASELPERTIDAITLVVAPFLRSPSHLLVTSTLSSFLPSFLPLIPATAPHPHLRLALNQLLPTLIEKLGDPKERVHAAARECIVLLGRKVYEVDAPNQKGKEKEDESVIWETAVKDALAGRSARAKTECLKLLLDMRSDTSIKVPLKPWLPLLVDLLEDSDGGVRDSARETVVALMAPRTTPPAARTQLKMLMTARNVRKSIADTIISRVLGAAVEDGPTTGVKEDKPGPSRSGPATPADDVEVVYIASSTDLQNEFRAMTPHFLGKETEHNWGPRERSLLRLRGMLRGRVFSNLPDAFVACLKGDMTDGIGKTLMSLRTTVAQQSCALVLELAEYLGPTFDPCAEALLPVLGKMAGLTKRIIADRSQAAVTAIIKHSTVPPRSLISHAGAAVHDKSVHSRQYGFGHLRTFLESRGKKQASASDSLSMARDIEQLIRRGLGDTNPQVREQARLTFWSFNQIWPREATALLETLDGVARKQLEKANPHFPSSTAEVKAAPKKPRASSAMSAMLAAKRAQAAELAARRSGTSSPQDELLATSPDKKETTLTNSQPSQPPPRESNGDKPAPPQSTDPATNGTPVHSPPQPSGDEQADIAKTSLNAAEMQSEANAHVPADSSMLQHIEPTSPPTAHRKIRQPSEVSPSVLERSQLAQHSKIPSPRSVSRKLGGQTGTSSVTSGRSRSSSLARTMSHSPPSNPDHGLHPQQHSSRAMGPSSPRPPYPHTPVRSTASGSRSQNITLATPRQAGLSSLHRASYDDRSLTSASLLAQQSSGDPAEEARRAQAAQGISAAEQLLDYDDDQQQVIMAPMTPLRHNVVASFTTPASTHMQHKVWEDSPKAVTPKLMKQLQSRPHERGWWNERRSLLKQATPADGAVTLADIQADIDSLAQGQPTVDNFQRLAQYSSANAIDSVCSSVAESCRDEWSDNDTFDRLFNGLLQYLTPKQPVQLLEHAMVLLWELVQNQWVLLESREDDLLDALFRLRTSANMIILESTNAMLSLLTDVCDPPFLLLLLHSALDRFLTNLSAGKESSAGDVTGDRAKAAGYNYGLNAMGMSILRLPKEAVAVEASRLEPHVMKALALTAQECVPARQAANRVILAIQCMLEDDTRTLALFPALDKKQRAFVTYQMEQNGVLRRPVQSPAQSNLSRQAIHYELVDGMARGSRMPQ